MPSSGAPAPRIAALRPLLATEGGRFWLEGGPFAVEGASLPSVTVGQQPARVVFASRTAVAALVPADLGGGPTPVHIAEVPGETAFLQIGQRIATGLHQVDSPAIDDDGHVYLTYSGRRGQQAPVSVYRVAPGGAREIFARGLTNPTSLALDPEGRLYVTSRFDGTVTRFDRDGRSETLATDLGVACGIVVTPDGTLIVGDRGGTLFRVRPDGGTSTLATLPASMAAFHLALAPSGDLFVTAPTLSPRDAVYRIDPAGTVSVVTRAFGRPQGLAFDPQGRLHVVEALAGASGLYRLDTDGTVHLVVAGAGLVGAAFDRRGTLVVASADAAYLFPAGAQS